VNVTPLALHSPRAVRETLRAHGWDDALADTAGRSLHTLAFHLTGLDQDALQALVPFAGSLGLEILTGDSWAIVSGSRSRLSALARSWSVPESLTGVAAGIGHAMPDEPGNAWRTARGLVPLDRPVLVGILNVTPDSFSDGGRFIVADTALAHTEVLLRDGAAIIDIGGESTRPGRTSDVPAEEEQRRVLPVVEALAREHPSLIISVDTVKSSVACAALEAGAAIINDVSGLRLDSSMASVMARAGAGAVLMHSRGSILQLASYDLAEYGADVVGAVMEELGQAVDLALAAGVPRESIVIDPGLGFSKTVEQNVTLFDQLAALTSLGRPILVGPSRKRFLGAVTGLPLEERDRTTGVACALAYERGARLFRVHDVALAREALSFAYAMGSA
jgi:dihydropteroate synthase